MGFVRARDILGAGPHLVTWDSKRCKFVRATFGLRRYSGTSRPVGLRAHQDVLIGRSEALGSRPISTYLTVRRRCAMSVVQLLREEREYDRLTNVASGTELRQSPFCSSRYRHSFREKPPKRLDPSRECYLELLVDISARFKSIGKITRQLICLHESVLRRALLPERFIFRQVYCDDVPLFLSHGELRAKNHSGGQLCHQTSYEAIVNRRGERQFLMPCGGVVNDYVPFYFSPITSFTFTIFKGNVPLKSPTGTYLRKACEDDRVFFIAKVRNFNQSGLQYCFSDSALNTVAPMPALEVDLDKLDGHVHWALFDEAPLVAMVPEIGYEGVCKFFASQAAPATRQTRSPKRMAEFLVKDTVPLQFISCIVAKSGAVASKVRAMMSASKWDIPIYVNAGCYFG